MNYVYRYMLGDQWIYVGKSEKDLRQRVHNHAKEPKFEPYSDAVIEYCELNTKTDMDITESMMIKTMHPLLNVVDKTDGSIPFVYDDSSVTWKKYIEENFASHIESKHIHGYSPYGYSSKKFQKYLDDIVFFEIDHIKIPQYSFEHKFKSVINIYTLMDRIGMPREYRKQCVARVGKRREFSFATGFGGPFFDCDCQPHLSNDLYTFNFVLSRYVECFCCRKRIEKNNYGNYTTWSDGRVIPFCKKCWPRLEIKGVDNFVIHTKDMEKEL